MRQAQKEVLREAEESRPAVKPAGLLYGTK